MFNFLIYWGQLSIVTCIDPSPYAVLFVLCFALAGEIISPIVNALSKTPTATRASEASATFGFDSVKQFHMKIWIV